MTAMGEPGRDTNPAALALHAISAGYGDAPAIEAVGASFPQGTMTAIVGPNGAGKSTLVKTVVGALAPAAGRIEVFGKPLALARHRLAYVPQRASVDWDFPIRVIDVVLMGLWRELGLFGRVAARHRARATECLALVGMEDFAHRQIGQLSGGQQQRVFLARALAQGADLYLLDEPFAGVDAATEAAIVAVLHRLRAEGRTLVAVHHDLATVTEYFDRVLILNRRLVAEGPVARAFTNAALATAYGGRLPGLPAAAATAAE